MKSLQAMHMLADLPVTLSDVTDLFSLLACLTFWQQFVLSARTRQ